MEFCLRSAVPKTSYCCALIHILKSPTTYAIAKKTQSLWISRSTETGVTLSEIKIQQNPKQTNQAKPNTPNKTHPPQHTAFPLLVHEEQTDPASSAPSSAPSSAIAASRSSANRDRSTCRHALPSQRQSRRRSRTWETEPNNAVKTVHPPFPMCHQPGWARAIPTNWNLLNRWARGLLSLVRSS